MLGLLFVAGSIYFLRTKQVSKPSPRETIITSRDPEGFDRNTTNLIYTKHARCRMDCRSISEEEVRDILKHGSINSQKSDPNHRPDPTYALEGLTHDGQEVRIVFALSGTRTVVVTVIDLQREYACHCN